MAGFIDILSAAQNIVTAINSAAQTYLSVNGNASLSGLTAATVVKSSAGRVCVVSVIVGGAGVGTVYDAAATGVTTAPVYTIPTTAGAYEVNIATANGIVVAPGSGQTVTVGFS